MLFTLVAFTHSTFVTHSRDLFRQHRFLPPHQLFTFRLIYTAQLGVAWRSQSHGIGHHS